MSEKRFEIVKGTDYNVNKEAYFIQDTHYGVLKFGSFWKEKFAKKIRFTLALKRYIYYNSKDV